MYGRFWVFTEEPRRSLDALALALGEAFYYCSIECRSRGPLEHARSR